MEPITYANGSTLEDPSLTYGIVFSNFMSKGVYTFQGGTDRLIGLMAAEMRQNGVDVRIRCDAEKIHVEGRRVTAVTVAGRTIKTRAVISNANVASTIFRLVGPEHFAADFLDQARAVRLNNSSTQVYMALRPGEHIDEQSCGDLLFSSTAPVFRTDLLLSRKITSRTYSFYYPKTRPGRDRSLVVSSTNAHWRDWAGLSPEEYAGQQAGPDREYAGSPDEVRARHPRKARHGRLRHAADLRALHAPSLRRELRHEVRGAGRQPRPAASKSPACTMPAAWASSCPAGWVR